MTIAVNVTSESGKVFSCSFALDSPPARVTKCSSSTSQIQQVEHLKALAAAFIFMTNNGVNDPGTAAVSKQAAMELLHIMHKEVSAAK